MKTKPPRKKIAYENQYTWILLLIAATFVIYLPALKGSFTNWDDGGYIQENPFLQSLSFATIRGIFSTNFMGNYHPLTMLSLALDYRFSNLNPFGFHLTNLLLHISNTILVYFVVRALTGRLDIAVATGLLFGVHTIHVESVAWVSERKDVLYTFFYLLAMFCYIKFTGKKEVKFYGLALGFFILSCLSKGQAVSFVFTLFLIDFFRERNIFTARVLLEKAPFLVLAVIFGVVALHAQRDAQATTMVHFALTERVAFASYGLVMYLLKLLVPISLSAYYPYPIVESGSPIPFIYWASIVPAMGVAALLWFAFKRSKELFFALGFFLLNIIFLLQFLPVGRAIMADRYAYIPSIGYCFFFGWFICNRTFIKNRNAGWAIGAVYLAVLGFLTFERTMVWKDSMVLWTDVLAKDRRVPVAWFNRGNLYSNSNEFQKAISDYTDCLKEDPRYFSAYINRGQARTKLSDHLGAIEDYNALLRLDPQNADAYTNRAMSKRMLQDYNSALADYQEAIRLKPNQIELYTSRGTVKFGVMDYKGALEDYDLAVTMAPDHPLIYSDRALIRKTAGDIAGAKADYDAAIGLQPLNGDFYNSRGTLMFQSGDMVNAIRDYSEAIRCNPKNPLAFRNRGAALLRQKNFPGALADYTTAISFNSKDGEYFYTRALIKKELNDMAGAQSDYQKAIELDPGYAASDYKKNAGMTSLPDAKLTFSQYYSAGQTLENQGNLAEAIVQYKKSLELKPDYAEAWYSLGTVYGKANQFGEAISCFNKALAHKKDYVDALVNLGVVKASIGKTTEALKDLATAISMNPGYSQAYFNRALVYLNTGKKEPACADLKKAISLGNTNAYPIYQKECLGK